MTRPSEVGEIKLSCFSAVIPFKGWNQWVAILVAPFLRPSLHGAGYGVGYIQIQILALVNGLQGLIDVFSGSRSCASHRH